MKAVLTLFAVACALLASAAPRGFMRGADVSSLAQVEASGGRFFDLDGRPADLFKILKRHGFNWIRLRVWTQPKGKLVDDGVLELARRAKKEGFKLLVDFHYSDSWADPGKQRCPAVWEGLSAEEKVAAIEDYTRRAIAKFASGGARPDAVQLGNETNNGFVWPDGKIWGGGSEKAGGMEGFVALLKAAAKGARAAGKDMKTIVHLAEGGDNAKCRAVLDPLAAAGVDFDMIGLSFYPYWHGKTAGLKANMEDLAKRFGKPVAVVETSYAWTKGHGDAKTNVFPVDGNEASVEIQRSKVREVVDAVRAVEGGAGVFYWEPAWLPSDREGSPWENQALFDFKGRALPGIGIWCETVPKGTVEKAGQ